MEKRKGTLCVRVKNQGTISFMKRAQINDIIQSFIPKLYALAFAIAPDEAISRRVVNDAFGIFLVQDQDILDGLTKKWSDKRIFVQYKKDFFRMLCSNVYKLSLKRFEEEFRHSSTYQQIGSFYRLLDSSSRATIYLKHKLQMSHQDIAIITEVEKSKVIERLINARNQLEQIDRVENPHKMQEALLIGESYGQL